MLSLKKVKIVLNCQSQKFMYQIVQSLLEILKFNFLQVAQYLLCTKPHCLQFLLAQRSLVFIRCRTFSPENVAHLIPMHILQDIYLLSQERNLNLLSNRFNKSFNPPENNISFIDKSPVDHPTIDDTAKTLPRLSKNGRFLRNMFASPEDSRLTGSSFSQNSKNSFSSPEFLRNHFKFRNASLTSYNTSTESESFHRKPSKEERYLFAKGIKRSAGFHDAELLEKRVKNQICFIEKKKNVSLH